MDAEVDLDPFALGGGLNETTNGGGGEALATDQSCDIGLAEDEAEVDFIIARIADAEFGEFWVADELKGDILDEVFDLRSDFFHGVGFCRSLEGEEGSFKFSVFGLKLM